MDNYSLWVRLALLGPVGKSPLAPGTVATFFVGIPAAYLISLTPPVIAHVSVLLLILSSLYVAGRAERELQKIDPQEVVIDELAGYLVTMIWLGASAKALILGFLAFRLFDIWKPWPVNVLQTRLKGGVAIVMDDVGAGIYAFALVWIILRICC